MKQHHVLEGEKEVGCKLARDVSPSKLCCGLPKHTITLHLALNTYHQKEFWVDSAECLYSVLKAKEVQEIILMEITTSPTTPLWALLEE